MGAVVNFIEVGLINKAICDALGIDPSLAHSVTIEFSKDAPVATIVRNLNTTEGLRVSTVLAKYDLVEK